MDRGGRGRISGYRPQFPGLVTDATTREPSLLPLFLQKPGFSISKLRYGTYIWYCLLVKRKHWKALEVIFAHSCSCQYPMAGYRSAFGGCGLTPCPGWMNLRHANIHKKAVVSTRTRGQARCRPRLAVLPP